MTKANIVFALALLMTLATFKAQAQNTSATTPGLNSAPLAANNPAMTNTQQQLPGNRPVSPMSGDRQTSFPESTSTGQLNSPATEEVNRQREQMNRQRDQIRNTADCATVTDATARANCEARSRTN